MKPLFRARVVMPVVLIAGLGVVLLRNSVDPVTEPAEPGVHEDTEATHQVEAVAQQTARLGASGAAARPLMPAPRAMREESSAAVVAPDVAELRRPLISAIRGDYATPAEKRAAMQVALESSGPTREPWSALAGRVFGDWHGGRMQSPPEFGADGQVTALWMMFRPESDGEPGGDATG